MKLYCLFDDLGYDGQIFHGIFSSLEKAEEAKKQCGFCYNLVIEECELDECKRIFE